MRPDREPYAWDAFLWHPWAIDRGTVVAALLVASPHLPLFDVVQL